MADQPRHPSLMSKGQMEAMSIGSPSGGELISEIFTKVNNKGFFYREK